MPDRDAAHEVYVPCDCGNLLHCRTELYVSDIRILYAELRAVAVRAAEVGARLDHVD